MKRLVPAVWLCGLVLLGLGSPALAQEEIRYVDRASQKETMATGNILDESPGRVVYRPGSGAATKEIAVPDILDITYEVPGGIKLAYGRARADEKKASDPSLKEEDRKKALNDTLRSYQEMLPRLSGEKYKYARRHTEYKIARLRARLAEEDREQLDQAIEALMKFKKEYPDAWQIGRAAKFLARLQLDQGDAEGARKTYEELEATPGLARETRQECELLEAEALILGKKYAEAEKRLQAIVQTVPKDDPQATRARIYLAQCLGVSGKLPEAVSQLEAIITQTADKNLKALAYNCLGDCYRLNGQAREAIWPYLWVDVIYHQDKQEHIKALRQLADLFEKQGDQARAKEFRDQIKKESR